jgi:hypothetical protein
MIIKGSSRGHSSSDCAELARHLLAPENESVELLEIQGCVARDLAQVLAEMRAVSLGTRTRRSLYHASISAHPTEAARFTNRQWLEAVEVLEAHLGLLGHQRVVVVHSKLGRRHAHVVWSRVHPISLKAASDGHSYRRHEQAARELEQRFGLMAVQGVHTRPAQTRRPVARQTHRDCQASRRSGVSVKGVTAALQDAWGATRTGVEFRSELAERGIALALGARGVIAVDGAGTCHSIPRRLGLRAGEVNRRLAEINRSSLPAVHQVRRTAAPEITQHRRRVMVSCKMGSAVRKRPSWEAVLAYWLGLGRLAEQRSDGVWVRLGTLWLHDRGDLISMHLDDPREPTDEEIATMVAAGRAHGWATIRFFGGSPEWQRRARAEAIRQGFRSSHVTLECEAGAAAVMAGPPEPEEPRPEHLLRRGRHAPDEASPSHSPIPSPRP